jgi:hypothetical protein
MKKAHWKRRPASSFACVTAKVVASVGVNTSTVHIFELFLVKKTTIVRRLGVFKGEEV